MSNVKQEVVWYRNYEDIRTIQDGMEKRIENGWRVHTCLNKSSNILVIYEKEAENECE